MSALLPNSGRVRRKRECLLWAKSGHRLLSLDLHNFHIRDGLIAKEIGYEIWRRDE